MYARAACARRARARTARVPCSLRRRGIYGFGREHESGTKCGRPMGRPYDVYSANWCNIRVRDTLNKSRRCETSGPRRGRRIRSLP